MKQSIQYGITLLFGIMLLSTQAVWAQGLIIGTVSDENGSPLPGTTVVVEKPIQELPPILMGIIKGGF